MEHVIEKQVREKRERRSGRGGGEINVGEGKGGE